MGGAVGWSLSGGLHAGHLAGLYFVLACEQGVKTVTS